MALQYGVNITSSDMRKLLEENDRLQSGVRTWRQLFGNAALGYNAQSSALRTDYSSAMAEAYKANLAQQNALASAGLNAGATREVLSASRNDLLAAYNTYIRNYGKDAATVAENYATEVKAIDTALTDRANNFANLYNSAYKYLSEELFNAYYTNDTGRSLVTDQALDWIREKDQDGKATGNILSQSALYEKLMNPDGSLNAQGVAFFDQMFNMRPQGYSRDDKDDTVAVRGFDEWLSATNPELRAWWVSPDQFNYTNAGTNKGTAAARVGRESTDNVYGAYEYADMSGIDEYTKLDFGISGQLSKDADEALKRAENDETNKSVTRDTQMQAQMPGMEFMNWRPRRERTDTNTNIDYRQARSAWQNYYNTVDKTYAELNDFVTKKMGSPMTTKFWEENTDLKTQYNDLLNRARKSEYYDTAVVKDIGTWYKNLIHKLNAFVSKHQYSGKSSGF